MNSWENTQTHTDTHRHTQTHIDRDIEIDICKTRERETLFSRTFCRISSAICWKSSFRCTKLLILRNFEATKIYFLMCCSEWMTNCFLVSRVYHLMVLGAIFSLSLSIYQKLYERKDWLDSKKNTDWEGNEPREFLDIGRLSRTFAPKETSLCRENVKGKKRERISREPFPSLSFCWYF